jgi:NADPH:quinone reductase-like Zn-dependent oxidoreductase
VSVSLDAPVIPETMQAVVIPVIGGPEVLRLAEVPTPSPGPREALIAVRTVAANRQDVFTMTGTANVRELRLPHIPGIDPSGVVVGLGDDVSELAVGDRVLTKPAVACGTCRFCAAGEDDACANLHNVGVHRPGGMAGYAAIPAANLFRIPPSLSHAEATAIAHSFPVALNLLARAELTPEDVVLVTGAAGAIGSATLQLAKLQGATVVAAVGGPDRTARIDGLGADLVLDYGADPRWADAIRDRFPDGATLYVEPAGNPEVWTEALRALGRRGRVAVCGAHAGPHVRLDLAWLFRTRATVIGCSGSTVAGVRRIVELAGEGRLRPAIDSVRPLADVRSAFERLLARQNRGKVILEVSTDPGWPQ